MITMMTIINNNINDIIINAKNTYTSDTEKL